jgi:hypothetical protein
MPPSDAKRAGATRHPLRFDVSAETPTSADIALAYPQTSGHQPRGLRPTCSHPDTPRPNSTRRRLDTSLEPGPRRSSLAVLVTRATVLRPTCSARTRCAATVPADIWSPSHCSDLCSPPPADIWMPPSSRASEPSSRKHLDRPRAPMAPQTCGSRQRQPPTSNCTRCCTAPRRPAGAYPRATTPQIPPICTSTIYPDTAHASS